MILNDETRDQFMRIAKARLNKWYTFGKQRNAIAAKMYVRWYEKKKLEEKAKSVKPSDFKFIYWDE